MSSSASPKKSIFIEEIEDDSSDETSSPMVISSNNNEKEEEKRVQSQADCAGKNNEDDNNKALGAVAETQNNTTENDEHPQQNVEDRSHTIVAATTGAPTEVETPLATSSEAVDVPLSSTSSPSVSPPVSSSETATNANVNAVRSLHSTTRRESVERAIREDYAAAEEAKKQAELESATTISLETIIKECEKQGFYRTPSCNEKLYLHHKGYNKIAEGAFEQYTDVKVLWLEGNCFANERPQSYQISSGKGGKKSGEEVVDTEEEGSDEEKNIGKANSNKSSSSTSLHCPTLFTSQHRTLRQFYLHGNLLMSTPRALAGFKVLDSVNLSDNFIEEIRYLANPKLMRRNGGGKDETTEKGGDKQKESVDEEVVEGGPSRLFEASAKVNASLAAALAAKKALEDKEYEDDDSSDDEQSSEEEKEKKENNKKAELKKAIKLCEEEIVRCRGTSGDYEWIDVCQREWEEQISSILDADDDDEDGETTKEEEVGTDENTELSSAAAASAGATLVLSSDRDDTFSSSPNQQQRSGIERRLRKFQKAIDYAVSLRSVPIPADGILRGKGAERWGGTAAATAASTTTVLGEAVAESVTTTTTTPAPASADFISTQHPSDTVTWIQIKNNHLKRPRDLLQLLTFSNLTSLDLSNNRIENNDGELFMLLKAMPQLKSLMLQGNPLVRQITPNYRKQALKVLPNLMYLDDRPVFADERRLVTAWAAGGAEGEKRERAQMKQEEDDKVQRRLAEFREIMRRGREYRRRHGVGLSDDLHNHSSDGAASDGSSSARGGVNLETGSDRYGATNTSATCSTAGDGEEDTAQGDGSTAGGSTVGSDGVRFYQPPPQSGETNSADDGSKGLPKKSDLSTSSSSSSTSTSESESSSSEDEEASSSGSEQDDNDNNKVRKEKYRPRVVSSKSSGAAHQISSTGAAPVVASVAANTTSHGTTFSGARSAGDGSISAAAAARNPTDFYNRNYGPEAADPSPIHRRHADPDNMSNTNANQSDGRGAEEGAADAPNTVSWGHYVIRDRNTTNTNNNNNANVGPRGGRPPIAIEENDDDDDFGDVVIGH